MLKRLKFSSNKFQKVYFTSDIHAFHKLEPLLIQRNVKTAEEHTWKNLELINSIVGPNDILINLGDWFLNATDELVNEYLDKLNCKTVFYIFGNHESVLTRFYNKQIEPYSQGGLITEIYPVQYKQVVFWGSYKEIIVNGQLMCLSHFPLAVWNEMKRFTWNLCGHSHNTYSKSQKESTENKQLDVGIDSLKRPYSFEEIKEVMDNKIYNKIDHH